MSRSRASTTPSMTESQEPASAAPVRAGYGARRHGRQQGYAFGGTSDSTAARGRCAEARRRRTNRANVAAIRSNTTAVANTGVRSAARATAEQRVRRHGREQGYAFGGTAES